MSFDKATIPSPSPKLVTPDVSNLTSVISKSSDMESVQMLNQQSGTLPGPVAILWDIENCPVPSDVRPEDVAGNIRMALRVHPVIKGAVTIFCAYGDFNAFPRRLREGCQKTGVKLVDVPNGRKDAADKAILVDMFLFALDNRPPSSIMLISGDIDFAPALHILGQRGYAIILAIPSGVGVSSALRNAGRFVWDWPSISRGDGFVPQKMSMQRMPDFAGYVTSCNKGDNSDIQNEEEAIVYRGTSQNEYGGRANINQEFTYNSSHEIIGTSQSLAEYNNLSAVPYSTSWRSQSLQSGLNEGPAGDQNPSQEQGRWVRPGDLQGLKGQIVWLLEMSGGSLPLVRLPPDYLKFFGRPLYMSEYGCYKLVHLINKMTDSIVVVGKGQKKLLCLSNSADRQIKKRMPAAVRKNTKEKEIMEDNLDIIPIPHSGSSSDEFSDDDKNDDGVQLESLRQEVEELLVCYSCPVPMGMFGGLYRQRYKKDINYQSFGADGLEELIEKLKDVVQLIEDPTSKEKSLVYSSFTG